MHESYAIHHGMLEADKPQTSILQQVLCSSAGLVCNLEAACLCVCECQRERREAVGLELQYWAQIISDYSHVCDLAGTLFEFIWARVFWAIWAGVIKEIWKERYEKQGDFPSAESL